MPFLTVLSPHQDDAALSLAMTIRGLARRGWRVRILNCFTVSDYAPHCVARGAAEVGGVRNAEDREFASRVGENVEVVDLGMEDAPIRLGCPVGQVRRSRPGRFEHEEARELADEVGRVADGMVLAPMGLGRHIDHLIAREAGIRLARAGRRVAFYEDLPYAAELRECCILRAADLVARRLGARLQGGLARAGDSSAWKRFAIGAYGSQLSGAQIDAVIGYGERLGGERLWGTTVLDGMLPALERAGVEAGSGAAWRLVQCAAHGAADRARAVYRRAMRTRLLRTSLRGGVNAPQIH